MLAAACPSPIIVQTDWHAQAEHGPTYELLGQDYVVDASNYSVTGTLVTSGEVDTGVEIEIREGGPATGWQQTASVMYQDPDIFLGYTSTDGAVEASADQPTVSVAVIMEKNPQIIMWNPEQFPGVKRVADLPDDTPILTSWMATYLYWLINQGIVDASQVEESYEAGVSRFVAEDGAYGQQGYASNEPYIYEVETPEYGKAVQYELTHDMGYETYSQNYGVLPERIEEDRACLELLVPILQQGMVDYVTDGAETNAVIMDVNAIYDDGFVYSEGNAEFGHAELGRLGLIGNGPDGTIGKHDMDRVQRMIDSLIPVFGPDGINIGIAEGLTYGDIATNEFIDDSIGLVSTTAPAEEAAGVLAAACPSPIIVQTDWHAQAEHGPTYELLGQDYVVDASNYSVTGTLVTSGEVDTGVEIEIREGGPATGWQQTASVMYQDPDIFLGYTSTDGAVEASADQPTVSVAVIMEKNPQIIMWNPEQFPGVKRVADLPDDTPILTSWMATYLYWLINQGIVDASQVEESYEAGVSRFVAEDGAYGQQGYASNEPYIYEVETPEYGKAVQYELTHDMGYETYSQNYGVLPERIEEDRACLELLVPILQQGMVDYVTDGAETNAVIMDVNAIYDDGFVYSEGNAEFGHAELGRLGLIGNGPDGTIGKHDMDRVQRMIDSLIPVFGPDGINIGIAEGLTYGDIATNEFIDDSIGLE